MKVSFLIANLLKTMLGPPLADPTLTGEGLHFSCQLVRRNLGGFKRTNLFVIHSQKMLEKI